MMPSDGPSQAHQTHSDNPPESIVASTGQPISSSTVSLPQQLLNSPTVTTFAPHTPGAWYSPLTLDEDSIEAFGFAGKDSDHRYDRSFQYAQHHFIGPMPVQAFLDSCMDRPNIFKKWPQLPVPLWDDAFASVPERASTEKEIYEPLIKSLNRINPEAEDSDSRCPGFTFLNTSNHADLYHGRLGSVKPDVCCYADHHVPDVQKDMDEKAAKGKGKGPCPDPDPYRGKTMMGYAAMFIEVKPSPSLDPFSDPPPDMSDISTWQFVLDVPLDSSTTVQNGRKGCFGQNITYATEILARQHRQFLYSICLCGSMARFIRWDRAGAIVTERFDIHQSPEYLCHFLWLFALMSDGQRGYDLTVETANSDQCEAFKKAIRKHAYAQVPPGTESRVKFANEVLERHYLSDHVTVIHIPEPNSSVVRKLLVSRPFVYPITAFGKAWRTYWAVDTTVKEGDKHRIVLLKDTWREFPPPSGSTEVEVLQRLRDGVQPNNVPEVLFSGDVRKRDAIPMPCPDANNIGFAIMDDSSMQCQTSLTQKFLGESWVCGSALNRQRVQTTIREHRHHRLVLSTPGHTLADFSGTQELLTATFDVVKTLEAASQTHHIVHRNLSPRSIILYADRHENEGGRREGYLIDWDQSWDDRLTLSSAAHYSPALQFLCASLASGDHGPMYSVDDDLESLLYVVLYLAVLWLPHEGRDQHAVGTIRSMFEDWSIQSGRLIALGKKINKTSREHTQSLKWQNGPFQTFIDKMLDLLQPLNSDGELPLPDPQWRCDNVKAFWEDFLHSLGDELPRNDRESRIPNLGKLTNNAPRHITGEPNFPTMPNPGTRGTKRYRQLVSDGAGTSIARHIGARLTMDAPDSENPPHHNKTSSDEDESPSKRRRLGVEPRTNVELEAGPSHLLLATSTSPSAFISSGMDFDSAAISRIPDNDLLDPYGASSSRADQLLGHSITRSLPDDSASVFDLMEYLFPTPLVAWEVDPSDLASFGEF